MSIYRASSGRQSTSYHTILTRSFECVILACRGSSAIDSNLASALWNYSDLLLQLERDLDRSDALLVRAFAGGLPEGRKFLIGRAIGYQRGGSAPRSLHLLEQAVSAKPDDVELRLFRGRYRIDGPVPALR